MENDPIAGRFRPPWAPWLRWLGSIGAALVALLVAARLAPGLQVPIPIAYGVAFTAVSGSALAAALAVPRPGRRVLLGLLIPVASLVALGQARAQGLEAALAVSACLLLAGSLLGAAVGHEVEHPGQVLFVVIVSAFADVLSLYQPGGVSHQVVQSEAALLALALPWPMLGTPHIEPLLGVGDVAFTALYVAAARAHGLGVRRSALALAGGYLLTLVAVMASQLPIPALPMLGGAMLIAHPEMRAPRAEDRRRGIPLAVILFIGLASLFLLRS